MAAPKTYEELAQVYPQIYGENFHFECGEGWLPLISSLSHNIHQHVEHLRRLPTEDGEMPNVAAAQVKEKFGGLRFYVYGADDYVNGLIRMAESMSYKMCEVCSAPGRSRSGPWIRTLCDQHDAEQEAARSTAENK